MSKTEKKLHVHWEKQGYNMCSEVAFVGIAKFFNKEFDMNEDGQFDQWDVPLIVEGECTNFWEMLPCMNQFLDCEIKQHRNPDDLIAKIDEGMPTMIRIRPRGNLPGEHHSILVVGYKSGNNGKRKILVHDPAIGKYKEYSEKRLLKEWKATKNAAIMCAEKGE